jgi:D-alanyl-D-alanine carboxypeptidase
MDKTSSHAAKSSPWGKAIAITMMVAVVGTIATQMRSIIGFARNWDDFSDGSVEAKQLRNVPDVLDYIALHRDQVSLVAFEVGDEANGIFLNADAERPLASLVQVQLLLGYGSLVARGELQPDTAVSLADWERYWLPRIDGGAHEYSRQALEARGAVHGEAAGRTVQIQDLVQVLARYNDDAAADYLMSKLGRAYVDALPTHLGMPEEDPAWPVSGQILSWQNTLLSTPAEQLAQRYSALDRRSYASTVWQLAAALESPARSAQEHERLTDDGLTLRLGAQAELTRATSPRGRARAYAQLMARIAHSEVEGTEVARNALNWPLQNPELKGKFENVGTKPGSLPGVLTSAYYARPKGTDKVRVLALFLDQLPIAVWLQLMQKFLHQRFELQLLSDDAFFASVKQRLSQ